MTDPYAVPPPDTPAPAAAPRRGGCMVVLLAGFVAGFVVVLAMVLLRAPDQPAGSALAASVRAPAGYVAIDDARSGGGRVPASRAAAELGRTELPGFRDGVLRAWGRRSGEPLRAVVVLVIEVDTAERATTIQRDYAATATRAGATPFATPPDLRATGFRLRDVSGRYAQRVAFTRGTRLYVVSLLTPDPDADTAEVVALATLQAAA